MKSSKPKILFAILNWGLGHASRTVPIIKSFKNLGYECVLASDGLALNYLQKEFPDLDHLVLPSYNIRYSKTNSQLISLGNQALYWPKLIKKENRIIENYCVKHKVNYIISDNRMGAYSKVIPSIYITHQLHFKLPLFGTFVRYIHNYIQSKYSQIWVPDTANNDLAGEISKRKGVKYIGPLSALKKSDSNAEGKILAVLSGPEPQRTILEQGLLKELSKVNQDFILIRGSEKDLDGKCPPNIELINLASADMISDLLNNAPLVISRSGYSSIMDYAHLAKPAILIPTPGQAEQEYLAELHNVKGNCHTIHQDELHKLTEEFILGAKRKIALEANKNLEQLAVFLESEAKG